MGKDTLIGWAHDSLSTHWGCVEVSDGCNFCYARTLDAFRGGGVSHWGNDVPRMAIKGVWKNFQMLQKLALETGEQRRVFVGSMMDIFEKEMPLVNRQGVLLDETTRTRQLKYFNEVVPATPNLTHLCLTKRAPNIKRQVPEAWLTTPPANLKYGYSAVDQDTADQGIPDLLAVPGEHFLSCEPLLGPLNLRPYLTPLWYQRPVPRWGAHDKPKLSLAYLHPPINWVIVGGESGPQARPMDLDWVLDIIKQCQEYDVPVFVKQLGSLWAKANHAKHPHGADMSEWPDAFQIQQVPEGW